MHTQSRHRLMPKTLENDERTYMRLVINYILMAGLIVSGAIAILGAFSSLPKTTLVACVTFITWLLTTRMTRRGYLKPAQFIIPISAFTFTTYLIVTGEGIRDEAVLLYPLILMLAGLLLRTRGIVVFALLIVGTFTLVGHAQIQGMLVTAFNDTLSYPMLIVEEIVFGFTAALLYFTIGNLSESLERSRRAHAEAQDELAHRKTSETALKQSEERYRRLVEHAPLGIVSIDRHGTISDVNLILLDLLGSPSLEATRTINMLTFPPLVESGIAEDFQECIRSGTTRVTQRAYTSTWGKTTFVELHLSPLYDPQRQQNEGVLATVEDISRRKQAEEKLRKYERMVSVTSDRFALIDRQYIHQIVNEAYLHDTGKRSEELIGHPIGEVLGAEVFAQQVKERLDRCLNGETIRYQAWFEMMPMKYQFMDVTYSPYLENNETISGVVVGVRDITDIKQAEEWLLQLAKAVETTRLGISITDPQNIILYVNPAEARMHGYTSAELVGRHVSLFSPPERHKPLNFDLFADEKTFSRESINLRKDGSLFPVYLISDIVRDAEGLPMAAVTTCEDISERKEQEAQLKQMNSALNARIEELSTLNSMTHTIMSSLDLQTILDHVVQTSTTFFKVQGTILGLLNAERTEMTIQAHAVRRGGEYSSLVGQVLRTKDFAPSFMEQLLERRQTVALAQLQSRPLTGVLYDILRARNVRSLLLVPLHIRGEVIGVMVLGLSQDEREFSREEIRLAETISGQITGVIQYARLFERERRQRQVAESLQKVALALNSSLDREMVLEKLLEQLRQVIQYDSAGVFLREGSELVLLNGGRLSKDFIGKRLPIRSGDPVSQVFQQHRPLIVPNVHAEPSWTIWPGGEAIQSWMGTPLLVGEEAIGVLTLDSFTPHTYHPEDTQLFMAFANQAATAIHNARLFDEAQQAKNAAEEARREAESANRAKSEFLANTSHELRTPLHAVLGNAQLLLQHQNGLPPERQEQVRTICRSGEQLLTLIDALIDISRRKPDRFNTAASLDRLFDQNLPVPEQEQTSEDFAAYAATLERLPSEWRTQAESASIKGDTDLVEALIEQIRADHAELAAHLTQLAEEFQYGEILKLLSPSEEDTP